MNGEKDAGKFDSRRAGGIGLTVIGGLVLAFATFFLKDPSAIAEANRTEFRRATGVLEQELKQSATDNSVLRERISVLERQLSDRIELSTSDRFTGTQGRYERELTNQALMYEARLREQADGFLTEQIREVDRDVDELRKRMARQ